MAGTLSPGAGRAGGKSFSSGYGKTGSSLTRMETEQRAATQKRETEVRGILDEIIGMYRPGGSFGQNMIKQATASGMQNLVNAGLQNTTAAAGVGMNARARLEDLRFQGLSSALGQKAGFVERIEDMLPNYNLLGQLGMYG